MKNDFIKGDEWDAYVSLDTFSTNGTRDGLTGASPMVTESPSSSECDQRTNVHIMHSSARSIEKCREGGSNTTTNPVMSRCPYPDGRRSNPTSEAPGTTIRPLPALRRRRTREGSEG